MPVPGQRTAGPPRNLLVVRAGDRSLHEMWKPPGSDAEFDLAVYYYGEQPEKWAAGADIYMHLPGGLKLPSLAVWLDDNWDLVSQYDYIGLADDDLAAGPATWSKMFATMAELDLHLAQPALAEGSFWTHPITRRDPTSRCRYTNFVEAMVPFFSRRALELCLPTFRLSTSGFGLDWVWPVLLRNEALTIGIVDEAAVQHTRPVSSVRVANTGDKTAMCNFLPHPAILDDVVLKALFGVIATDPVTLAKVPAAPSVAELGPVSFIVCQGGLAPDLATSLAFVQRSLQPADEVVIVAVLPTQLGELTGLRRRAGGGVKTIVASYGSELSGQYGAGVANATNDTVVVVPPGCNVPGATLEQVRAVLRSGPLCAVSLAVDGEGPSVEPVLLAGDRQVFGLGSAFASARSAFANNNASFGAVGSRELFEQVVINTEKAGWPVTVLTAPCSTLPLNTALPLNDTASLQCEAAQIAPSQRVSLSARRTLAPDVAKIAHFAWPFLTEDQHQQLLAWGVPPLDVAIGPTAWPQLLVEIVAKGYLGFAALTFVWADLAAFDGGPSASLVAEVLVRGGTALQFIAEKLPRSRSQLASGIKALSPEGAHNALDGWWQRQPAAAVPYAMAVLSFLPAATRGTWQSRHNEVTARSQLAGLASSLGGFSVL